MIHRLISLLFILGIMILIIHVDLVDLPQVSSPTLVLGFLLLSAYCIGSLLKKIGLPLITGYIFAGLFLGPYFLGFYTKPDIKDLEFLNSLALAFIAFYAGAKLKYENIRHKLKSISYLLTGVTLVVFTGVTSSVFLLADLFPFMQQFDLYPRLAIASIFGVIAVARSPSSAIAIISEAKAKGEYTDTVLSVTIAMDLVIIIFFAVIISVSELVLSGAGAINVSFILELLFEIIIAFILGFLLGRSIVYLIERVHVEFPVVICAMGFLVIKFSHFLGEYLNSTHEVSLNIEPLLICMAAGFTVQNFSKHGKEFLRRMDDLSFLVYVAFFAITGASIQIDILITGWQLGLIVFATRIVMIMIGSYTSGRLSGDDPRIYKNSWLGFVTQAGVSLGLLSEVERRFPDDDIGKSIKTILIASITLNQIIGPIMLKYALDKTGESNVKKQLKQRK